MRNYKKQTGFSLMELMVVIAIIGVLAAVAMPLYTSYTKKAKFTAVIGMTEPVKAAVAVCLQRTGDLTLCDAGSSGIPVNLTSIGDLASLQTLNSVITATGGTGVDSLTYTLTANLTNANGITWTVGGTCVTGNSGSVSPLC